MEAGVAGFFGAVLIAGVLPLLLCIVIGWWIGDRAASLSLSARSLALASLLLCLIAMLFWYPSLGFILDPDNALFAKSFGQHLYAVRNAVCFAFATALLSAALSWALSSDEYSQRRNSRKSE